MSSDRKILIAVITLSILSNVLLVFYYERKLNSEGDVTVIGGFDENKKYTAEEILSLIKKSPEYIGDSIVIYKDGKLRSDNIKFQGTINAVSINDRSAINQEAIDTGLPKPFLIYKLAAHYYRLQYADEFKLDTIKKNLK